MTLMATILAIGAAAYAAFGEHEMTSAAAQTWGAIIVAAFALDVLCAVAKPRCASNAPEWRRQILQFQRASSRTQAGPSRGGFETVALGSRALFPLR
jgi:hypothetical protein